MTDLYAILPSLSTTRYAHLIPSLERSLITTCDLLTLDPLEVAHRARLPALDVKGLISHVGWILRSELDVSGIEKDGDKGDDGEKGDDGNRKAVDPQGSTTDIKSQKTRSRRLRRTGAELVADQHQNISLGDERLNTCLGGGIRTGYITEIVGESGAGKTQFLLGLLLQAQLAPQHGGLGRASLYVSTEHALPTARLAQQLTANPRYHDPPAKSPRTTQDNLSADQKADPSTSSGFIKPSLERILSIQVPDLESQDHILNYQLPVALERYSIGLVVIDSIAANYRAEKADGRPAMVLAIRSGQLIRLGGLLRRLAIEHDCAIVVANQVSDRFDTQAEQHPPPPPPPPPPPLPLNPADDSLFRSASSQNRPSQPARSQRDSCKGPANHAINLASQHSQPFSSSPIYWNQPANGMDSVDSFPGVLGLDHQQRFFTGWGSQHPRYHMNCRPSTHPSSFPSTPSQSQPTILASSSSNMPNLSSNMKTPSLGLTWANQIACRIALIKSPAAARIVPFAPPSEPQNQIDSIGPITKQNRSIDNSDLGMETAPTIPNTDRTLYRWRRWMKLVFCPWAPPTGENERGVEFAISNAGIRACHAKVEDQ